MSQMKTLFVCMILIALPASQVSADVDETNSSPEEIIDDSLYQFNENLSVLENSTWISGFFINLDDNRELGHK